MHFQKRHLKLFDDRSWVSRIRYQVKNCKKLVSYVAWSSLICQMAWRFESLFPPRGLWRCTFSLLIYRGSSFWFWDANVLIMLETFPTRRCHSSVSAINEDLLCVWSTIYINLMLGNLGWQINIFCVKIIFIYENLFPRVVAGHKLSQTHGTNCRRLEDVDGWIWFNLWKNRVV